MDIIRNKKRTLFSLSDIQSSFKKKLKDGSTSSDILPTTAREEVPVEEDSVFSSSDESSSQDEQESSDEDNHKISRKQKSLARQATRRDRKREMQHLKKKDKNKISMEDFLSKQTEFNNWLEEEKHKNYRDMSSPKRKVYFKTFLKLWNKKKLPQKYYRGSTVDIDSPTPVQFNLFEEPAENSQLTAIKRPKSKRLSVEQAGFLDSPFSTFGKTPPKLLQHTSLDALNGKENVTPVLPKRSTFGSVSSPRCQSKRKDQVSPILELSEYQIPLNSVRVGENLREERNGKKMVAPYSVTSYPWTDSDASSLKSDLTDEDDHVVITQHPIKDHLTTAVYAVPMKAKGAKCQGQGHTSMADNFYPPPVPPKPIRGFSGGYATVDVCGYKSIAPHQKHNVMCDSSSSDGEAHFMPPPSTPNGGYATLQMDQDDFPPPPPEIIEEGSPDNKEPNEEFPSPPLQFKDKIKPPSPLKPKRSPYTRLTTSKPLNIPVVNQSKLSVTNTLHQSDDDVHYVKMLPISSVQSGSPMSQASDDSVITDGKSVRSISTMPGKGNTRREYSNRAQLSVSVDSGVSECSMLTKSEVEYIENKSNRHTYWKGIVSSQYAELDELKMEMFVEEDSKSEVSSEIKYMKPENEHKEIVKLRSNVNTENTMKNHPKKSLIETEVNSSNLEKYSFEHKGQFGSLSPFICTRRRKITDKKSTSVTIDQPRNYVNHFSVSATSNDEGKKREEEFVSNNEQVEARPYAVPECSSMYNENFGESCTRSPRNPPLTVSCKETTIPTRPRHTETDESSLKYDASLHQSVFASSRPISKISDLDNVPPQAAHVSPANRGPEKSKQSAVGDIARNDIKRSKLQDSENSYSNDQTLSLNLATVDNAEILKTEIRNLPSIQEKQKNDKYARGTGIAVEYPRKQSSKINNTENQLEMSISPQDRDGYLETDIDSLTSTSDEGHPNNGLKRCQSLETVIW